MTENERQEEGWVCAALQNQASPVLALMVQMRLGEKMGAAWRGGAGTEGCEGVGLKGSEPRRLRQAGAQ